MFFFLFKSDNKLELLIPVCSSLLTVRPIIDLSYFKHFQRSYLLVRPAVNRVILKVAYQVLLEMVRI